MRQEEHILESFWSKEEQARKHCHVATSPCRDVTKSRRGGQLFRKSTIHHVATSSRRDVTTSRRLLKILHLIIKCEEARESRADGSACGQRHEIGDLQTLTGGFSWIFVLDSIYLLGYFWIR